MNGSQGSRESALIRVPCSSNRANATTNTQRLPWKLEWLEIPGSGNLPVRVVPKRKPHIIGAGMKDPNHNMVTVDFGGSYRCPWETGRRAEYRFRDFQANLAPMSTTVTGRRSRTPNRGLALNDVRTRLSPVLYLK